MIPEKESTTPTIILSIILAAAIGIGILSAQSVNVQPIMPGANTIPFTSMQQLPANVVGGNPLDVTGDVIAITMNTCATAASALTWTNGTGFACNTAIDAATVNGGTPATASGSINQVGWFAATGSTISGLSTANNGVLVTSGGGVPSISTTLPSGLTLASPVFSGTVSGTNTVPLGVMAQIGANTVLGNATSGTANVAAVSMPGCSSASSALIWTSGSGPGCNTSINAATLGGATFAAPGAIGGGTPGTAAFSSLTVNGIPITPTLSGTTGSIGGGLLAAGGCTSGTVSITGAASGMATIATPNTYPGDGTFFESYVSSSNTVTVKVCAVILATPNASTYNVRVIQ